jgi:hypothetical protein
VVLALVLALADLTVPPDRLPSGCALSTAPTVRIGNQVRSGLWAGLPISTNPWIGADRATVAAIVERVIDPPPVPDGPPLTKGELARFRSRLADDVEAAYAAIYADGDSTLVTVHAVRYTDASLVPSRRSSYRARPGGLRLTVDRTVLAVSGTNGACSQAVITHVRELAAR